MADYYYRRAQRAGRTKSPNKTRAAQRASMLAPHRLNFMARKYPHLAEDIAAYQMASAQEKALQRAALVEKIERLAQPESNLICIDQ